MLGGKSLTVKEQTSQYLQNKIESIESIFHSYHVLLKDTMKLSVILRENREIHVLDDFCSLFIDKIKTLDGTTNTPSEKININSPTRK